MKGKRPNFLLITTDEERFPPPYENDEAKAYRLANSKAIIDMMANGLAFNSHHAAATACSPSRTSIYTGQYPSLHGVSQTPGIGKSSFDQNMFWLKPNTVPTMGNYFRAGGYQTWYRGKWHLSHADLDVPGTQTSVLSNSITGEPYPERIRLYEQAEPLDSYGFKGWIGPEPHGAAQNNDGSIRDPGYADQVVRTIAELEENHRNGDDTPFLLVSSFVNPHDIVFSENWGWFPDFTEAQSAGKLPHIAPAPTAKESLQSKPRCQQDYLYTYPRMYIPQPDTDKYRQFYYYLIAEVHKHIARVYKALQDSCFADNTIVIFTSDHGETLGAHGGLQQKWYNAYSETLHVPLVFSNKHMFKEARNTQVPTSHIDLLPTMLGLADINAEKARKKLAINHSEAQPLVGRDMSAFIRGDAPLKHEPIYFMTDDNPEVGTQMNNLLTGTAYNAVIEPKHLETVITKLAETGDVLWKYTHYFDNARFDVGQVGNPDGITNAQAIPSEYECYNMSHDPLEQVNLLNPSTPNALPENIRLALEAVMISERKQKRLRPTTLDDQPDPSTQGGQRT